MAHYMFGGDGKATAAARKNIIQAQALDATMATSSNSRRNGQTCSTSAAF
jgi:hypothetical protein